MSGTPKRYNPAALVEHVREKNHNYNFTNPVVLDFQEYLSKRLLSKMIQIFKHDRRDIDGLNKAFHKMVMCIICKTKFENAKDLQEHEKEHWQKNVLPYACSKCDKAFSDISDIAVHIRQDHNHKRKVENLVAVHRKVIDNEQRPNKKVKVKKLDKSSYLQSL